MHFHLDAEQQLLSDSVARFVEREYGFEARARRLAGDTALKRGDWTAFADNGWLAAALPEVYGGLDGSVIETAIICQQLGRGLVLAPYLGCAILAVQTLATGGAQVQRAAWLPGLCDGSKRLALAYSEGGGAPDEVATVARSDAQGYRLTGRKTLVLGGSDVDGFVVSARREGAGAAPSLFLVPAEATGVSVIETPLHDGQPAAEVVLQDAQGELLGEPECGLAALHHGLAHATAGLCAELVGVMERTVEITAEYLRNRQQFGVPLAGFQALQHRMADMAAELELARSMLFAALAAFESDDAVNRAEVLSGAKAFVSTAALNVCGQGIQLHGGIGMTEEYSVGHYFKRAVVASLLLGGATLHDAACAKSLQERIMAREGAAFPSSVRAS